MSNLVVGQLPAPVTFSEARYLPGHQVDLLEGGASFFDCLLDLIASSRHTLHFQVYIFEEDSTGILVAEALKNAAARGVAVFLIADSFGSKNMSPEFITGLRRSGVQFRFFSPLPRRFYAFRLGRRLHHKVVVADGSSALVGGINIADKYRGSDSEPPWLDFAVLVRGPVCAELARSCERIFRENFFGVLRTIKRMAPAKPVGGLYCKMAQNDWFRGKNQVRDGYRSAVKQSRQSVCIVASYFLPGRILRRALRKATERGVQVKVLLPGKSDLPMARHATRYLYRWLLQHHIQIFEWHNSILHGKLALVDDRWATIGSYNLNHLSQYSSIEMNIEVLDEGFAASLKQILSMHFADSVEIRADNFHPARHLWARLIDWGAYVLARWIMLLLFFLVRREHRVHRHEE